MILTYQAVDARGQRTRDTLEAADEKEALEQLRRRGLYVTHVAEAKRSFVSRHLRIEKSPSALATFDTRPRQPRLSLGALVIFTRQVAMLLHAGSAVVPAIVAIKKQTRKPSHVAVLGSIVRDLEDGTSLTDALRQHPRTFSPVYCAIVAAGEAGAKLAEMFERLAGMVVKHRALRNKVLGALAYPLLLVVMSCGILSTLLFFVIPRFGHMFDQLGVDPPASTELLLVTARLVTDNWLVLPIVFLSAAAALLWIGVSETGRQWLADMQMSLPIVGRMRARLIQAQVFRTIGTLLDSGVGVLDTLDLARQATRNRHFQALFDRLEHAVTSGGRLSTAFEQSAFVEPYVCQAVSTGEDSGNLGSAMTYCADMLDESNAELIGTSMKLLEPVILIGMGILVGIVAVSLFMPLFDLTAAVQ